MIEAVVQTCSVKRCSEKFHKIHRKTPVPESLFNKAADLRLATLLKKRLCHRFFPVNFVKFLRTPFLDRTLLVAASVVITDKSKNYPDR